MKWKYSGLIRDFCENEGIHIPVGFKRHPASHLAVIRTDNKEPKLVAKTFFKKEDLSHYIRNNLVSLASSSEEFIPAYVMDFKLGKRFYIDKNGKLVGS